MRTLTAVAAVVALYVQWVMASVGDRSGKFHLCVKSCEIDTCRNHRPVSLSDDTIVVPDPLPWYLILTGWSCESNCEYHCTHRITNEAKKRVRDIRAKITDGVMKERTRAKELNERWLEQLAWEKKDDEFKELCGDTHFLSSSGTCVPLLMEPPPPLLTESEARHNIDTMVALELSHLPAIDKQAVQFYGKWPQLRILGMQEPMSVLFSLLNLVVQLHAWFHLFPERIPDTYPLKDVYLWQARLGSMAWVASAVFHTRDVWWTERWDYFSAAAVLLSGLFLTLARLFYFRPDMQRFRQTLLGCIGAWVLHVTYLLLHRRLDYTYNMTACLTIGIVHNVLWLLYAIAPHLLERMRVLLIPAPFNAGPPALSTPQRQRLEMLVAFMFLAPALELFDFPPLLRLIDAHALWHCATIPLTLYWYQWLANDARECVMMAGWHSDPPGKRDVPEETELTATGPSTSDSAAQSTLPLSTSPSPETPMALSALPFWTQAQHMWGTLCEWTRHSLRTLRDMLITS